MHGQFFFFWKDYSNNYMILPNFVGKVEISFYFVFLLGESKYFHVFDDHFYLFFWNFLLMFFPLFYWNA